METKLYLTVSPDKRQPQNDGYVAIISEGSPQKGDKDIKVLSIKIVSEQDEAKTWFKRMIIERPWEKIC
jgi:hypothetical protein